MTDHFRLSSALHGPGGDRRWAAGQTAPPVAPPTGAADADLQRQVEYVEVDALVTDRNGEFVRDLTKDDFQVFEDGKPQPISTFSLVDIPVERLPTAAVSPEPIEPDVKSNERPFDGRVYVMVLDDLHTDLARTPRVERRRGSSSSSISARTI